MALLAGLAASISGGIIGSYVVTKRIVFISGSISHAVLGGMGLFLFLKRNFALNFLSPIYGALLSAIASAFLLGWVHLKYKEREDSIIAAIWAIGMSIGVIFITFTPGYNVELMNFLFGNILWITRLDMISIFILDILVVGCTFLFYRKFQAICFDEEQAALQGVSVKKNYIFLLCLIAISVVILIQIVGAVLVISMLTMPAAIAAAITQRLSSMMKAAVLLGSFFTCLGIYASYELNWPPGATITLVSGFFYGLTLWISKSRQKQSS